jgi:DNA-directed RNA polymerase specialized sigma24 family protein
MQDVSFRIFRQIRNLREPKVFRAWTFRIATRLAFAQMKKAKRWCELENDSELIRSLTTAGSSAYSAGTAKSRLSYGVATIRKSLKEQTR